MKRTRIDGEKTPVLHNLYEQLSEIKLRIALMEAARGEDEERQSYYDSLPQEALERKAEQDFHGKMDREIQGLIQRLRRKENGEKFLYLVRRSLKFAAVIFLVCGVCLGTAMAVSSEVRVTVMKLLYNITPQYTEISTVPDENAFFTVPSDWNGEYYPSYIPDGYAFRSIQGTKSIRVATYDTPDGKRMTYHENDALVESNLDTEGYEVREIELNGRVAILAVKEGGSIVVWQEDNRSFYLFITEDSATALDVVRGVRKIK